MDKTANIYNEDEKINEPQNVAFPEMCIKKSDRIFLHIDKNKEYTFDKSDSVM